MDLANLTHLILVYRYWIILPLSFIEGPVVAFASGTLAAAGYFNVYALLVIFFLRDIGLDTAFYVLGWKTRSTKWANAFLKKLGVTRDHLNDVSLLWERRPAQTMLIGKLSYGISATFIIVAGMVGMRFKTFLLYGAMAAIVQYCLLVLLGYFFGVSLGGSIIRIVQNVQYLLLGGSVIFIAYYMFGHYARTLLLHLTQKSNNSK